MEPLIQPGSGQAPDATVSGPIVLAGRPLRMVDLERRTVRHDAAIKAIFLRAGIFNTVRDNSTDAEMLARKLLDAFVGQQLTAEIAALWLLPETLEEGNWTQRLHADLVEVLNTCSTEDERMTVENIAFEGTLRFFAIRLRWLERLLLCLNLPAQPDRSAVA